MPALLTPEEIERIVSVQPVKCELFTGGYSTWGTWNNGYTSSCTTTGTTAYVSQGTWGSWNTTYMTTGNTVAVGGVPWVSWNATAEETEEQRAERERRDEEIRAQWEERRVVQARDAAALHLAQEAAGARAVELLLSLLSEEQAATYREHGWFEVRGSSGRRWRIRNRGQSGNVDLMPEIGEEREMSFCAHPAERLPDADAHVAQMLALVTDDEAFERTANVQYRRPDLRAA